MTKWHLITKLLSVGLNRSIIYAVTRSIRSAQYVVVDEKCIIKSANLKEKDRQTDSK